MLVFTSFDVCERFTREYVDYVFYVCLCNNSPDGPSQKWNDSTANKWWSFEKLVPEFAHNTHRIFNDYALQ